MVPSGVLDAKRIYLEISVAHRSFPYDVRLGKYVLLVKEGPTNKVAAIKGSKGHVSLHYLKDLPTCERAPSRAS